MTKLKTVKQYNVGNMIISNIMIDNILSENCHHCCEHTRRLLL